MAVPLVTSNQVQFSTELCQDNFLLLPVNICFFEKPQTVFSRQFLSRFTLSLNPKQR